MVEYPYTLPLPYPRKLRREYEQVAMAVRDQVFEVYEQYLRGELFLDPAKWKLVKKCEDVQIHYSRQKFPPSALHRPLEPTIASPEVRGQADWMPMVKLVFTGTTLGTLDDVMYGAACPTPEAMLIKSMTIRDDFYFHRTLCDIQIPTVENPFTYVGLRWSCRAPYIGSLIKARDMVYVECTGFRDVLHNGDYERVGYAVYHSVQLPDVPPLDEQQVIRSKYSAIVLYRQAAPGVVEVFNTTSLFPNGDLLFKVTAFQAAEALKSVCKMTESAMKKKLVWMQAARAYGAPFAMAGFVPKWQSRRESFTERLVSRATCIQCSRSFSALRSLATCEICATDVCSSCITSRKLVLGHKIDELVYKSVAICKGCIHTAQNMDNARELAVYEFVQPFDHMRPEFESVEEGKIERLTNSQSFLTTTTTSSGFLVDEEANRPPSEFADEQSEGSRASGWVMEVELDRVSQTRANSLAEGLTAEKLRLWRQINELCLQAEKTYHLAVRQTQDVAHLQSYLSS